MAIAVAETRLDPRQCVAEIVPQGFWKHHALIWVVYSGWPHLFPYVAVGDGGGASMVSGDSPFVDMEESSLENFNRIASLEKVRVTEDNAKKYMEFFLDVYLTQVGRYLESEEQAKAVLKLTAYSDESKAFRNDLGLDAIVTSVRRTDAGFLGTAYTWGPGDWIDVYEVQATENGITRFQERPYGEQPRARSKKPEPRAEDR